MPVECGACPPSVAYETAALNAAVSALAGAAPAVSADGCVLPTAAARYALELRSPNR